MCFVLFGKRVRQARSKSRDSVEDRTSISASGESLMSVNIQVEASRTLRQQEVDSWSEIVFHASLKMIK